MSGETVLSRYLASRDLKPGAREEQTEREPCDDCLAFGWLRGIRDRALMLELRRRDGSIVAISYAWLERLEFDPSEGIRLFTAKREICIRGRNLNTEVRPSVKLFEGLARHRVPWVREADRCAELQADERDTIIETIAL